MLNLFATPLWVFVTDSKYLLFYFIGCSVCHLIWNFTSICHWLIVCISFFPLVTGLACYIVLTTQGTKVISGLCFLCKFFPLFIHSFVLHWHNKSLLIYVIFMPLILSQNCIPCPFSVVYHLITLYTLFARLIVKCFMYLCPM